MKIAKNSFLLAVIFILSSCSKEGSQFIGKWQNVARASDKLEIVQNGKNFLVVIQGKQTPATYTNGNLEIRTNQMGLATITISYIEKDDKLVINGFNAEFIRDE